jgi:hypothetical protein
MYSGRLWAPFIALLPAVLAQVVDPALVGQLRVASTQVDRISLLTDGQVSAEQLLAGSCFSEEKKNSSSSTSLLASV